jgi:MoxR-like ATPase
LIEDIPGVGKSTLAQALAATLGLKYSRIQFTSDLLPADVLGVSMFDEREGAFRFLPGPIFNSVVLADEINRAPPKSQSALLEAMEERQVSLDGQTRKLPDPFFVIATQNPVEQIGAFPLPESQLDRFLMAIELGYPDAAAERELLASGDRRVRIAESPALADSATLAEWQRECAAVHVAPALLDYVQALLAASRGNGTAAADAGSRRGLSPRAGLMLVAAARAWALIAGRPMVLPEDVQAVFPSVAGHRLAGGARAGMVQAQALVRAVALP